jgi:hypothetical protein
MCKKTKYIIILGILFLFPFVAFSQEMDEADSLEFEITLLQVEVENLKQEIASLNEKNERLRNRNKELLLKNDTLLVVNKEIQQQLQEKNTLLEDKIKLLQQKEILFAEKEQVYKDAISSSNVDKAKVEGLLEAKNANLEGKDKEIQLLQKNINEKEHYISTKDQQLQNISAERDKYFQMSDTLREKLKAAEIIIMQREEELKYTRQRAEAAEEKVTLATNRKKKVRVIQGMAMRLYPTPEWTIQPRVSSNGVTQNTILNKNSGSVDFDLVVGASMMLYDLTKPNSKFSQDIGLYVGFGGNNLFKNFYVGPSYKFLDFFHLTAGINIAQYEVLADGWSEGDVLPDGWAIQTTREWKVTAFISLSFDLDFISYIGKK